MLSTTRSRDPTPSVSAHLTPPRFTCLRMQTPYERPRPFHSALSSLDSTETRRSHTNQLRHLLCKGRVQQIPSQTFRLSTNTLVHLSTTSSLGKKWRRESVEGPGKSLTACPFTNKWPFCPDVGRTYNYITRTSDPRNGESTCGLCT